MNEQDKEAYREYAQRMFDLGNPRLVPSETWQAALEYARSQQEQEHTQIWQAGANAALEFLRGKQEPVAWINYSPTDGSKWYSDMQENIDSEPLYTHPAQPVQPAEQAPLVRLTQIERDRIAMSCQSTQQVISATIDAMIAKNGGKV